MNEYKVWRKRVQGLVRVCRLTTPPFAWRRGPAWQSSLPYHTGGREGEREEEREGGRSGVGGKEGRDGGREGEGREGGREGGTKGIKRRRGNTR